AKYRRRHRCIASEARHPPGSRDRRETRAWPSPPTCPCATLQIDKDSFHGETNDERARSPSATMKFDPEAVREFEHDGWQRAAAHYTKTFARATRGFIDDLLGDARVSAGMRVLDLACGPGEVAAAAAGRGALPVGLDFSSEMIALARAGHPAIR